MTTRRVPSRKKAPVLPPAWEEASVKKAKHLPLFGPGIEIMVPLHLLPAYLALYSLQPLDRKEVQALKEKRHSKPDGLLWVKRVAREAQEDESRS